MAGVMAVFLGQSEITVDTMERAIVLGDYYLEQYLRHGQSGKHFVIKDQTMRLLDWLQSLGKEEFDVDFINRNAPTETGVRNSVNSVRAAMQRLANASSLRCTQFNSRDLPSSWKLL